jgi:hypothetical protein
MENVITYEEFKKVMKAKAEEETGKSVIVSKVFRNNGVTYDGLNIVSEECNVNPVIDLTRYYNELLCVFREFVAYLLK